MLQKFRIYHFGKRGGIQTLDILISRVFLSSLMEPNTTVGNTDHWFETNFVKFIALNSRMQKNIARTFQRVHTWSLFLLRTWLCRNYTLKITLAGQRWKYTIESKKTRNPGNCIINKRGSHISILSHLALKTPPLYAIIRNSDITATSSLCKWKNATINLINQGQQVETVQ